MGRHAYDLEFHRLAIEFDRSDFLGVICKPCDVKLSLHEREHSYKVHPNSRDVAFRVCVVGKSQQQTRLSNTRVTDQQELEKIVVSESKLLVDGRRSV